MELICNNCGATINPQDINIATNMAKCGSCNAVFRANELKERFKTSELLVLPPNAKVQLKQHSNGTLELGATALSLNVKRGKMYLFFALVTLVVGALITYAVEMDSAEVWFIPAAVLAFWIPGTLIAVFSLDMIYRHETVYVNENEIVIERKQFLRTKRAVFSKGDIEDIRFTNRMGISGGNFSNITQSYYVNFPAIISKPKVSFFFHDLPLQDQEWVVRFLRKLILGVR
jgi:hypothetical protein